MDIMAKALELGTMIGESDEMQNYSKAEIDVQSDEKALALLNDYKLLQIEIMNATKEDRGQEVIESIKARLDAKEDELNTHETTKNFFDAKTAFDKLMHTINDVIIHAISGEESCSSSGGCSSCSGCK
jgi:cell fate (sporulation/competence/biofilm development) regulator YlbF (YheA/YmcA/DUF963 family)